MLDNPVNGILEATGMITRRPPEPLRDRLGCLFTLSAGGGSRVRTVPDGCSSIIIELTAGESPKSVEIPVTRRLTAVRAAEPRNGRPTPRCLIGGPRLQPACYKPPAMTDVVGVRLNPGTAFALIGNPVSSIVDRRERLADLIGTAATDLEIQMARAQSVEARFDALECFLIERLAGASIDSRVARALCRITESAGEARLAEVARECGISLRQLERLMLRWVGISPKRLARIARFQALLGVVADGPPPQWTPLAAEHYADQSQLIREFTEFAGKSPRRYFIDRPADSKVARCP